MTPDHILKASATEKERSIIQKFTASRGWVETFVKRNALRAVSLHGEGGQVQAQNVAKDINILRSRLRNFETDDIYNVDQPGLFYKLLSHGIYVGTFKDRKYLRGIKTMKSEDHVTAFVCTNATRTRNRPMAIIGTAKQPRCFKSRPPAVPYFHQKNAWGGGATFRQCFYVGLPLIRRNTSRNVALLIGNCGCHGKDLVDTRGHDIAVVQYRALQGGWKEKKLSGMTSCPDWGTHV